MKNNMFSVYLNTFISHIGYYSLMPLILFLLWEDNKNKLAILLIYLSYLLGYRALKLFLTNIYESLNPTRALYLSSILAGLTLLIIQLSDNLYINALLFFVLGSLFSIRGLFSQKCLSLYTDDLKKLSKNAQRLKNYFNYAAFLGPLLTIVLVLADIEQYIYIICGMLYILAGLIVRTNNANTINHQAETNINFKLKTITLLPKDWLVLILIFFGWFFYAQLFTSYALNFSLTHDIYLIGFIYVLNSFLVLLLTKKISNLDIIKDFKKNIFIMFTLFCLAFLLIVGSTSLVSYLSSIVIFTLAEVLFGLSIYKSKEKFSLKDNNYTYVIGITTLIGEFTGSFFAIYTFGNGNSWLYLGVIAMILLFILFLFMIIIKVRNSKFITN